MKKVVAPGGKTIVAHAAAEVLGSAMKPETAAALEDR